MNEYSPNLGQTQAAQYDARREAAGQASPALGGQRLAKQVSVLEQHCAHLTVIFDRLQNTDARVQTIIGRAFGAVNEIAPPQAGLINKNACETQGSVASMRKLADDIDSQITRFNKLLEQLEALV